MKKLSKFKNSSSTSKNPDGELLRIPIGKMKCYVTDKLRPDTPEEHVRQRIARSLVEEYGYQKKDLQLEYGIVSGRTKKRADIVIFEKDTLHVPENIIIIVEAKRSEIKPTNTDNGISQLHSYLSATLNVKYGLWVGSEIRAFEKLPFQKKWKITEIIDIPFADGKLRIAKSFADLVPATDSLKDVFKRCHNYVAANQGSSKEAAFHEFLKITFCKAFDERNSSSPHFYIDPSEMHSQTGQKRVLDRIQELFTKVCATYGYIFNQHELIELTPKVCSYIVGELQKYSLVDTDFDYKGQAYETIVGVNSRGDRGEFFTPRNLCQLATSIVLKILETKDLDQIKVLDPACGTGGFLRSYIYSIYSKFYDTELQKWKQVDKAKSLSTDRLKTFCDKNVYGIDFNPILVRAAQMNLVMHGDGSTNILHDNSLLSWGEWKEETRRKIKDEKIDLIMTNPPFGKNLAIDDPHILNQYELSSFDSSSFRAVMAPQVLFVEKCYKLLKPNGLLAIITPDNIITNPSYTYIRKWILLRFRIIATISLPVEMFEPSTGTQTSLLIMKKRESVASNLSTLKNTMGKENVFISNPKKIGHDLRGNSILLRDLDGNVLYQTSNRKRFVKPPSVGKWIEQEFTVREPLIDDDLSQVYSDFVSWLKEESLN